MSAGSALSTSARWSAGELLAPGHPPSGSAPRCPGDQRAAALVESQSCARAGHPGSPAAATSPLCTSLSTSWLAAALDDLELPADVVHLARAPVVEPHEEAELRHRQPRRPCEVRHAMDGAHDDRLHPLAARLQSEWRRQQYLLFISRQRCHPAKPCTRRSCTMPSGRDGHGHCERPATRHLRGDSQGPAPSG